MKTITLFAACDAVCKAVGKVKKDVEGLYSILYRLLKNRIFLAKAQRTRRNSRKFA